MDYVEYVLYIANHVEIGWDFTKNHNGKLVAFHSNFGSWIFDNEKEFIDWLKR